MDSDGLSGPPLQPRRYLQRDRSTVTQIRSRQVVLYPAAPPSLPAASVMAQHSPLPTERAAAAALLAVAAAAAEVVAAANCRRKFQLQI